MKRYLRTAGAAVMIAAILITAAAANEYRFAAPTGAVTAAPTTVDQMAVVGAGPNEQSNIDRSQNTALLPPAFGSPTAYQNGTGTALVTQGGGTAAATTVSAISGAPVTGAVSANASTGSLLPSGISTAGVTAVGSSGSVYYPPALSEIKAAELTVQPLNRFTLLDGMADADGVIGQLKIPSLKVDVKVYETEDLEYLAKGTGHFASTSCWDGNVGIAGHNRGVNSYFGEIHTLRSGDRITFTTKLGTRTYQVFYVGKIKEDDFSRLGRTDENLLTLITCVRDVPNMRWCVQAREVV